MLRGMNRTGAGVSGAVVLSAMLGAGCLVLLARFDPAAAWWFPSCPLYALTGWQCPFCGTLRAAHALLHGEVLSALMFNPLTVVGGAASLAFRGRTTKFLLSAPGLATLALFGLVRNLAH
jgi:Protein of unknown function (DUF2752)